ncbi:ribosome small subunit-dependent GTPase A [Terribacillus saccharophilus]|uniref:Small ribosomal subunit biogenesis GTPase RsgA n=1 Tax=Terribacillus saccharophilus TaxID=361277 RepID=A0A268AAA7_9BACI|nr:ribosome small subunit-dependent GTPase A [Terribacillus saccharophilus]PAD21057.1 ribosome small subunit-dependent GTPase A [Terribacillus saccharophilus]PAF17370.1 ribosome small subunit-dependent GTPase A [Terribacillus saccharophilus]PAF22139.1 ribosome small subunit-dependent GTPase A [Terribacillus saccharophilus]PAF38330.1 ribosome small subunit-dependent GTPase A [Terribacillus saccharophilus]PAF40196.1 ribosome small subunit-dependent GTPase A [Terribacillus saccharophilus]
MPSGKIMKALSGFYYVLTEDGETYQCRGRGVFRKQKITPLVGDQVEFEAETKQEGYVLDVGPRKNELVRPPIANIDQAIIVTSAAQPDFSTALLDRFLVLVESKAIEPVIFITKMDMLSADQLSRIEAFKKDYQQIGYSVEMLSSKEETNLEQVQLHMKDKISVIAGQSGVGKSSMLNAIDPRLDLETNEISESLGRGRHTTRHVELIPIGGGLVADTPGFSSLEFTELEAEELPSCFPEFRERQDDCKFRGCMHHKEPKCAVKLAVEAGDIPEYRYTHYLQFLEEIKSRKPRY